MADRCLQLAAGIQMTGGDPTLTNPKRIAEAAGQESCNGLSLKVKRLDSRIKSLQVCKLSRIDGLSNWSEQLAKYTIRSSESRKNWTQGLVCWQVLQKSLAK